jgi:general secretion pathway protein I
MVALAVLAGALMAVAELSGGALRNFGYARDLTDATLLARAKLAELEERLEDSGFQDADEILDGDFADMGRPDVRWRAEVLRPTTKLSPEQLLAVFMGSSPDDVDAQSMLGKLLGGGAGGAAGAAGGLAGAAAAAGGAAGAAGTALGAGGAMGTVLQAQLKAFAEELRRSLRELRLTVSWGAGKREDGFSVATHLVVLNPRAPGGARGASPDVPANLSEPSSAGSATPALPGIPVAGPPPPATPGAGAGASRRAQPEDPGDSATRPRPIRTPRGTHTFRPPEPSP